MRCSDRCDMPVSSNHNKKQYHGMPYRRVVSCYLLLWLAAKRREKHETELREEQLFACRFHPLAGDLAPKRALYVDTGVKIIISVVVGGVILAGLYALFKTTILPNLNTEIGKMFNYSGT